MLNNNIGAEALSVSDVNKYIKMLFNTDDVLSAVAIRGEISNFKKHTSGHMYFTLKDSGGEIAAVMFRGDASRLPFIPSDGMRIIAYGSIDVYEKSGRYQVYVKSMVADGVGAMAEAYERLRRRLEAEGLFAEERKRPIPRYPQCIGVITAPEGAAIRDILNITGRRYPQAKILIYPSLVQGADAPASLCAGLQMLNAHGECDVIIIGRGGGSAEDLWGFNDESVVRAVAASSIPVISAVGHETDFTLCDFVADLRAPTPSAAAEIATPDGEAIGAFVTDTEKRLYKNIESIITDKRRRTEEGANALAFRSPEAKLSRTGERLLRAEQSLDSFVDKIYFRKEAEYVALTQKLRALDPLGVLKRGYSAIEGENGRIIGSVKGLCEGQRVKLVMSDGSAEAQIISTHIGGNKNV